MIVLNAISLLEEISGLEEKLKEARERLGPLLDEKEELLVELIARAADLSYAAFRSKE